jgi:hypothetical protein
LDSIEKFRLFNVGAMSVTLPDNLLHSLRGSMGGSAGAKAEARFRERGIEDRRKDLAGGLLNETVDYVGNSEQPLTATFFRDGFATYRAGPVRTVQELLSDAGPVGWCPDLEILDRHAVRAGGSPVTADLTPGSLKVFYVHNLLHQSVCWRRAQGWLIAECRIGRLRSELFRERRLFFFDEEVELLLQGTSIRIHR